MEKGYTLVAFTDSWGYTKGGINAFNTDFLVGLKTAYQDSLTVVCVVLDCESKEVQDADSQGILLLKAHYKPESHDTAQIVLNKLAEEKHLSLDEERTVFLGHDRISGEIANLVAEQARGRSAVIHHMSYDHYESVAENAASRDAKIKQQKRIFKAASIKLAIGPLLRDALDDLTGSDDINMLIPGLADIDPRNTPPKTFSMFVSGRLDKDASKIKQGQLAVAACAAAVKRAVDSKEPKNLITSKLLLRGVSFENDADAYAQSEFALKQFAEEYAGRVININPLPYTTDRDELFDELKSTSAAAMPSWHEGFGLVAWEAIAAEIPLILSEGSGVYQLLEEAHPGCANGFTWPVDISGSTQAPYFSDSDLECVNRAITEIARDTISAKIKAKKLKSKLAAYTWAHCAETAVQAFGWDLKKGVVNSTPPHVTSSPTEYKTPSDIATPQQKPRLTTLTSVWQPDAGRAVSVLLRAGEEIVPFDTHREPELEQLVHWAQEKPYSLAVHLLRGAGGVGKTRLANELAKRLQQQGWNAGFYTSELATKLSNSACLEPDKPNLLIFDYAETRTDELIGLLKHVLSGQYQSRVRILLLARDSGEWWDNLPTKDTVTEPLLLGQATTGPVTIHSLYEAVQQRQSAFQSALQAYANVLSVKAPRSQPSLTAAHFAKPLYIQMLALLTLHGEQPSAASSITKAILNHEQRYWAAALNSNQSVANSKQAKKLLALVTLAGNFRTAREASSFWRGVDDSNLSPREFSNLFDCLAPLYPGAQGLQAIRPDLLGEELVSGAIVLAGGDTLLDVVLGANSSQQMKEHALTILARVADYRAEIQPALTQAFTNNFSGLVPSLIKVAQEANSCLPRLAEQAFSHLAKNTQHSVAAQIKDLVTYDSTALNYLVCAADKVLFDHALKKASKVSHKKRAQTQSELARTATNFSASLARIGQHQLAKQHTEQAVAIYEQLTEESPQRYLPDSATSLSNCAGHLSEVGEYQVAKQYAERALAIREQLAEESPQRYLPDLATSLSNYAGHLSEVGEYQMAKQYAERALEIREQLAEESPQRYLPGLATSLNNYASHLSNVGEYQVAIESAERALEIREQLAEVSPQRYLSDLATSLSNYASHLSGVGEYQLAKQYAERAMNPYEQLAEESPQRHLPDLAASLSNYASHLSGVGEYQASLTYAKRAESLLQPLVEELPQRHAFVYCNLLVSSRLIGWLNCEEETSVDTDVSRWVSYLNHEQSEKLAFIQRWMSNFIEGETELSELNILHANYQSFKRNQQVSLESYYHLLCARLFALGCLPNAEQWQKEWHQYQESKNQNLPKWLYSVAERLGFDLLHS